MIKRNTITKIMAYLNKDNHVYKHLDPVQAHYIRTHVPTPGDIACIITAGLCEADGNTCKRKAGVINPLLETISLLEKNRNFTGLRHIDLYAYAWAMLTDMSMLGYVNIRNEYLHYAAPFPFTGNSVS